MPLRKTASSSWEMRVLASRGAWGPRGLQRVPWAPHSLLSAAADPPPCSVFQPCLAAQSGWVLGCVATLWPSLWPAAGLGPPVSSGAARPSGPCTANKQRLLFVIRNLMLKKKNPKNVSQQVKIRFPCL